MTSATNQRRKPGRGSTGDLNQEESSESQVILTEISEKMSTLLLEFEAFTAVVKDEVNSRCQTLKEEFKETRELIVNGLARIATNQAKQATCQQSEDKKEGLEKKIVPWKHNLTERKMTFWLYWKNMKLTEKYQEYYQSNPPKKIARKLETIWRQKPCDVRSEL